MAASVPATSFFCTFLGVGFSRGGKINPALWKCLGGITGGFMGATRVLGQLGGVQSKHHGALEGVGQQDGL